jgi:hypothetical protein
MADGNGYRLYPASSGTASSAPNEAPALQQDTYPDQVPYPPAEDTDGTSMPTSGQQNPWVMTTQNVYGAAPGGNSTYQYHPGSNFPTGHGAGNESNFQAPGSTGSYRHSQPTGTSRYG